MLQMKPSVDQLELNEQLGIRESALLSYYHLKYGNPQKVLLFIQGRVEAINGFHDAVYWLWTLGQYMQTMKEPIWKEVFQEQIERSVEMISTQWNRPQQHWLNDHERGIYISNCAMAYGALLTINYELHNDQIAITLNQIRELVFARMIKDGKVVSSLGDHTIHGDILMTAVPFGMLGIEDRILIEALYELEANLVDKGVRLTSSDTYYGGCERADLTCLLAWYYSEKGDLARAKWLVEQVEAQLEREGKLFEVDPLTAREPLLYAYWKSQHSDQLKVSELSLILLAIAKKNYSQKLQGSTSVSEASLKWIHHPTGTDDPYVIGCDERSPRYPQEDDHVIVQLMTEPLLASDEIYAEVCVNGEKTSTIRMELRQSQEGQKYWQAALGAFQYGDSVEYSFYRGEGSDSTNSGRFAFGVRKWQPIRKVQGLIIDEHTIGVVFSEVEGLHPVMTFSKDAEETVLFKLDLKPLTMTEDFVASLEAESLSIPIGTYTLKVKRDAVDSLNVGLFDANGTGVWESYSKHDESIAEVLTDGTGQAYKVKLNLSLKEGERWYGLGERYTTMQYRGLEVDNYVYNQYREQGLRTYMPNPFGISSSGYGVFCPTYTYSLFQFGTHLSDLLSVEVELPRNAQQVEMYFFAGKPLDIIQSYTDVSGKPTLPPKWAFGPWMSSNNWDTQAEVLAQVKLTEAHEIPATVIVLEQWSDEATFYIFNDAQYVPTNGETPLRYDDFVYPAWGKWPNPKGMVEDLHASGLKVLLWQIPIHKHMYGTAHAQKDADEQVMLDQEYHVKQQNGEPYRIPYNWFKDCLILDFTNPAAREWWFSKRRYLLDEIGMDGFKTDGGECVFGLDLQLADGTAPEEMRNRYPNDYIGSYYDFVQQHVEGGGITFSRAGYTGAQKYPLHWAGDERSTFAAFRASVLAGLSSGMSGIPFWGWDLAGFHGDIPSAELFIRGTQMAAFCPVMQYHAETKGEFNQDRTPWNIAERTGSPDVIPLYKKYADMRMNLLPYIYNQAIDSSVTGAPLMRSMFAAYPDDASCAELTQQYIFGDSLLVAPIMEEGATTKEIYFPCGRWISLFGGEKVDGSKKRKVKAALEEIPVYMRENRVVPLNLAGNYVLGSHVGNRVDLYEQLCFYLYLTDAVDYTFTDDMGTAIVLKANLHDGKISIQTSLSYDDPITLVLRDIHGVTQLLGNTNPLGLSESVEQLKPQMYCLHQGNLYIQLGREITDVSMSIV